MNCPTCNSKMTAGTLALEGPMGFDIPHLQQLWLSSGVGQKGLEENTSGYRNDRSRGGRMPVHLD